MSGAATAHIDLNALAHNLALVQTIAQHSRILAVIKANAYGHGLVQAAKNLESADALGVARLSEAISLREAGIQKPIILLDGFFDMEELAKSRELNLTVVVHSQYHLSLLERNPCPKERTNLQVWLKLNTGVNRLGFNRQDMDAVLRQLKRIESIDLRVVMSHFSCADDIRNPVTQSQIECFHQFTDSGSIDRSIANSGGIIGWPQSHFEWVRPGIMLYGISPFGSSKNFQDSQSSQYDHSSAMSKVLAQLKPVMTLKSQLIAVNKIKAGTPVGYGATWICKKDSVIGVVAIGYGDGYSRQAKTGTPVLVSGKTCPVVGTVSMDMLTVDLTHLSDIEPGEEVTLWGEGLPAAVVADFMNTIPYELTTSLTSRVSYRYE